MAVFKGTHWNRYEKMKGNTVEHDGKMMGTHWKMMANDGTMIETYGKIWKHPGNIVGK